MNINGLLENRINLNNSVKQNEEHLKLEEQAGENSHNILREGWKAGHVVLGCFLLVRQARAILSILDFEPMSGCFGEGVEPSYQLWLAESRAGEAAFKKYH